MALHERIRAELRDTQEKLADAGVLPSVARLAGALETFRARFGPEVLRSLDGEKLLEALHDHSNRDSLVYWLEFKDDDEFPDYFGSIAGGSALKFGIYRRKETGAWMTGSPQNQRELPLESAVAIARRNRDQLIRGCELIARVPMFTAGSDIAEMDAAYASLQQSLSTHAADVSDSAWGHKYFSLMNPDRLDDYHSPDWQRYHLIRLLQVPPPGSGRYLAAGRFVKFARELELPVTLATWLLNERNGTPRSWWRVGTTDNDRQPRKLWPQMRTSGFVAAGWPAVGDLSASFHNAASKETLRRLIERHYPSTPQYVGRQVQELFNFRHWMTRDSIVLAADGATILGIGRISGDYFYDASSSMPHRLPVQWLEIAEWKLPITEGLRTSVFFFKKPENLVAIERRRLEPAPLPAAQSPDADRANRSGHEATAAHPPPVLPPLEPFIAIIRDALERKGQIVLYGPPGTGKTWHAERAVRELAARERYHRTFDALDPEQRLELLGEGTGSRGAIRMCCFHPAYGYEDFLEGYRPVLAGGETSFELRDGVFKRLCLDASAQPEKRFYLIIDEINRGDIPRIFGELMTVIEKSRRGRPILLPLSSQAFRVSENVRIIGTMNTADRSIALLDTALRRRFGFLELMPEPELLRGAVVRDIPLEHWLRALNRRICEHVGHNGRNLQIGHAYLMEDGQPIRDFDRFALTLREDLIPLLEEYCYGDYAALERILGPSLVHSAEQRIRHELFKTGQEEKLRQALLQQCPDVVTAASAVAAGEEGARPESEDEAELEGGS